ncbi:OmpA family protein [bacterium]|nr:OmpA family protein [bacterium]
MAIHKKGGGVADGTDNIFWTTMSDLMLGLCIVFMTLFILAMTGFTQQTIKAQQQQAETAKKLTEKLKIEKIDAEVDIFGNVKISDVELFEVGSYTLSAKGKNFLNKFAPIYIDTIFGNEATLQSIDNIIVQGHTDSQMFRGAKTQNEQFSKNMFLSLQRAYAVQDYMLLHTQYNKRYNKKLRKLLIVEGRSYADPVLDANGNEDLAKSRRVELKLKVKGASLTQMLGFDFGGHN